MSDQPVLPYGSHDPTSGYAGSQTSEARAREDDASGTTGRRQQATLSALNLAAGRGLTYAELGHTLHLHHGQASGVLSSLHKAGYIDRLTAVRGRCKVYVLPAYVGDRPTETHGSTARTSVMAEMADVLALIGPCEHSSYNGGCVSCRATDVLDRYLNR